MSDPLRHPEKAHRPDSAPQPKKPDWIRVKAPTSAGYKETREIMRSLSLSTAIASASLAAAAFGGASSSSSSS